MSQCKNNSKHSIPWYRTPTVIAALIAAIVGLIASQWWGSIIMTTYNEWEYIHHNQEKGQIENGYKCQSGSDCSSTVCRSGPQQKYSFCTADRDCGFPGRIGYQIGQIEEYRGRAYLCQSIFPHSPEWSLAE